MHRHHFRQVLPAAGGQRIAEGLEHEIFDLRQHALGEQIFLHDRMTIAAEGEQRQRAANAGAVFSHRAVLQQRAVERLHQPTGQLAISGVIERQLAVERQHKLLAVKGALQR